MKLDRKRIYRSICAMFCALAMIFSTISPAMLVVQASNGTGQKMLKITDASRDTLTIKVTNPEYGKKYTFTCDYYFDQKDATAASFGLRVYGNNASTLVDPGNFVAGAGTATVTITPTEANALHSTLYIGIQIFKKETQNVAYIRNCTLTVEGSDTNLITNSDFSTGDLAGWDYNMVTCATGVTSKGVVSVVDYDGTMWGETVTPKAYMLKLTDASRDTVTIKVANPEYGKKYTFTCDYYFDQKDTTAASFGLRVYGNNASTLVDPGNFVAGAGTATVTITPTDTNALHSTLYIGIQIFKKETQNVAYIRNCTLTVEGSDTNLITNSNFASGTLEGWDYNMETCGSTVTSKGVATIVDYDGTLWRESTATQSHMLKLTDASRDTLTIKVTNPEYGKKYTFTCDYYFDQKDATAASFGLRVYGNNASTLVDPGNFVAGAGTATVTITPTEVNALHSTLYIGIQIFKKETQNVAYIRNCTLTVEGSDTNLITNSDFSTGDLAGWDYNMETCGSTVTSKGVASIVEYDATLWKNSTPDGETPGGNIPGGDLEPDPKDYMLKVETNGQKYQSFVQGIQVEAGKTYVLSFDYYVMRDGLMQARIYDEGGRTLKTQNLASDEIGTVSIEYAPTSEENGKIRYFGVDSLSIEQQFGYMWNFQLVEKGSDDNLFANPEFKYCSMKDWYPSFVKATTDISESGVFTIMEYDESKLTTPEEEIAPDPKNYMLKVESKDKKYQSFVQGIKVEAGKTYVFSFDYYVMRDGVMQARIYDEGARRLQDQNLKADEIATLTMEYTATTAENGKMRYFGIDTLAITDQFAYMWNFKLVEKGTDENLFRNPDFKHCSMKNWYPSFTKVTTDISRSGVFTVMEYDESKLTTPKEVIAPDAKNYMLKVDNKGKKYQSFVQGIKVEAGKTYVFTLNYYVMEDGVMQARVYDEGARLLKDKNLPGGKVSSMTLEYTATAEEDGKMRYFGVDSLATPDQFGYMWNFKLVQKGSSENLFENPDFKHLSMKHWCPSFVKVRTNISESGVFTVMEYDESKFVTPITYLKIPTGDPKYMAKLTAKYEADGKTYTHQLLGQKLKVEVGKTYIFSFNYYASPETTSLARIYSGKKLNDDGLLEQTVLQHRIEGTMEIEIVAPEEELFFMVNPGALGYCYVWNLCVRESGSDTNLFRNADFSEGNGSWYKWMIAGETVLTRDIKEKRGHAICAFDRQLWIDLVDEVIPSMEPQDPNKIFSFDDLKKYYEIDHTVVVSDEPTQLDNMSTASKVVIGVSAGLLGVLAIAVVVLLNKKKKGMEE